ncbi:hypothetical protein SPRG_22064 [Saprolegnia parasitica CBS 223.65]|uniref:DUF676 domain-containing protein n=1 Tax=Saprolegnia parasitica (strain CBS 223.65) TaxID=695850 RepID=A0A067D8D0_SAPPC|nr:hypothetical protein SPRG_22064 [Saprolegnia parasitica CBS 223.65]KDO34921.1 hypothetical protein SPRG_22064 [Saprolegnia parasitica CBS 223.65]|eukprot:XP_012194835.1 hypothetical protein SPRG_22064 [Saprolegnia parasitica CBS 223.65]
MQPTAEDGHVVAVQLAQMQLNEATAPGLACWQERQTALLARHNDDDTPANVRDVLPMHLVVLVHGNNGHPTDFDAVAAALVAQFPPGSIAILQSRVNMRQKTRAGIAQCGHRLALEVLDWLLTFRVSDASPRRLSMLGHSFGGLLLHELAIRKELKEVVAQESCMNNLGTVYLKARDPEAAMSWFTQARDLAIARANVPAQCLIHYNLSLAQQALGNAADAAQLALAVFSTPEPIEESLRVSALQVLAATDGVLHTGAFLEHATLAYERAEGLGDPTLLASCASALAIHYFEAQAWEESAKYFDTCLRMAIASKNVKAEAVAHYHVGSALAEAGQRKAAEAHFLLGLEQAKALEANDLAALLQAKIGIEYLYHHDTFVAKAELSVALQKARFAGSHAVESYALTGLGHVHMMESLVADAAALRAQSNLGVAALVAGDLDEAMSHFRANSRTAAILGDRKEMARAHYGMGLVAKEKKRRGETLSAADEPVQLFTRQRSLAVEAGARHLEILALKELVAMYDMTLAFERAQDECEELIGLAINTPGETVHLLEAYRSLANVLSSQLSLLQQRGSRFHDTIKVLMHKREEACNNYKRLADASHTIASTSARVVRQDVDHVVRVAFK